MDNQNLNSLTTKKWFKQLICLAGIASVTTIAIPVLAKFYPRYSLFQPYAYSSYPYRDFKTNIADTLAKDKKFANLVDELKQAGLLETLKQPGPFTILAPTDDAFNALPADVFKRYSQPENRLKVLKYHLVAGAIAPKDVDSGAIKTVQGQQVKIAVNADGTVKLNDANGKHPSTVTKNGVIIEVDRVLLPADF